MKTIRYWLTSLFVVWLIAGAAYAQSTSVKVWDGTRTATVRDLGSSDSLNVAISDGSGNQITSFGGGTQYTEGDVDASVTGTAAMWRDAGDVMTPVTAAKPLPINVTNASIAVTGTFWQATQPVSGTLTCNAGTNLNTSALATSAKQDDLVTLLNTYFPGWDTNFFNIDFYTNATATAVQIMDDWDESDRAKVNPIVGQAGVAAGAGNTGATVQRVVQAADVGAPLNTNYGTIYQGTTALTVKRAIVSEASSGDNEVVAAVALKKIVVLSARVVASAAVNAKWRSATTDIDGLAYLTTNSGYVLPYNPAGWYVTAAGEALNLNLSGAVPVGGVVQYVEAD